jgi:hypothetical protein
MKAYRVILTSGYVKFIKAKNYKEAYDIAIELFGQENIYSID